MPRGTKISGAKVRASSAKSPLASNPKALSDREEQILGLAALGYTDQAICDVLQIGHPTVRTYWGRIRLKLGSASRAELVAFYVKVSGIKKVQLLREQNKMLLEMIEKEEAVLRKTQEQLHMMQSVFAAAADAIVVSDKDLRICQANEQACSLFGYTMEDMLTLKVPDLIPAELRRRHRNHVANYLAAPKRIEIGDHGGAPALRSDGSIIMITAAINLTQTIEGPLAVVILRPFVSGIGSKADSEQ